MSDDIAIEPIEPWLFWRLWPHIAPHMMQGLSAATDLTLAQVVTSVLDGDDTCWIVIENGKVIATFLTASFEDEETGQLFLGVFALGGRDLKSWGTNIGERMAEAAKERGCGSVRFCGGKGWSRVLPSYRAIGERDGQTVYERAV
jgi:hypothetical protein